MKEETRVHTAVVTIQLLKHTWNRPSSMSPQTEARLPGAKLWRIVCWAHNSFPRPLPQQSLVTLMWLQFWGEQELNCQILPAIPDSTLRQALRHVLGCVVVQKRAGIVPVGWEICFSEEMLKVTAPTLPTIWLISRSVGDYTETWAIKELKKKRCRWSVRAFVRSTGWPQKETHEGSFSLTQAFPV